MEIEIKNTQQLDSSLLREHILSLEAYSERLRNSTEDTGYTTPESALHSPFDTTTIKEAREIVAGFKGVKKVFLVGIGGSDMGTRALYEALRGPEQAVERELIDFDTLEPKMFQRAKSLIAEANSAEEIVCIVISKSGSTTETIANANIIFELLKDTFGEECACRQTIVITGEDTPLHTSATERGIRTFPIPQQVGGRFSVFTNVGLIPLVILGFDIDSFCDGAQKAITASANVNKPKPAAIIASILFEAYQNGSRIHELFFWNPELEMLGKWYRQLLAESIGKQNREGACVGFSPSIATGSVDLHSLGQLIFGGRNDRFTTFVSAPSEWQYETVFSDTSPFRLPMLDTKTPRDVFEAIYSGVKKTYDHYMLPYVSIEFSSLSERELGAFMGLHMTTVMYVAKLMEVNAFDQPAVETYKKNVRSILTNNT